MNDAPTTVTLWDIGSLYVSAELQPNGDVLIAGQDLGHPLCDEYEYWITVNQADVPRLVTALGGTDGAHPLALLQEHAEELITKGEKTWIEDHGIVPEFFNRMGDPREPARSAPTAAAPESWDDFATGLTGVLSELEVDEYLVLESTANHRFVQVAFQDFAIRIESVGEQYLQPSSALSAEQVAQLENLGYDPATHRADVDDDAAEGSPNYWMELPTNAPRGSVATLMADTLRRVHLVESPRDLIYDCVNLGDGHIPQPSLGIGRIAPS